MHVTAFANTFLVPNGSDKPTLRIVGPDETLVRQKRPHRKSRLGCINCKKRKVKCDEAYPCGHCVKRKEACLRSRPQRADAEAHVMDAIDPALALFPFAEDSECPVNLLHMELLHHFEKVTIPTLSFQEVWPSILQLAFREQHGYLVNAMLSLGAAHMSYLVPNNARYRRAGCSLLGTALADFRQALSVPMDAGNCDALLGTSVLIQHLTWTDLSFLDDQGPSLQHPLDLSQDQLFLLSPGIWQIFHTAWPLFHTRQSVFTSMACYRPCTGLEGMLMERDVDCHRFSRRFMDLYDDPRYHGGRNTHSSPSTPSSRGSLSPTESHYDSALMPIHDLGQMDSIDTTFLSDSFRGDSLRELSPAQCSAARKDSVLLPGAAPDDASRAGYERLATRLSVVLSYLELHKSPEGLIDVSGNSGSLLSRYIFSFAILCVGSFLPMILKGDSRALALMFHLYRAARILLPAGQHWWCHRRAVALESMIGDELRYRGLDFCTQRND